MEESSVMNGSVPLPDSFQPFPAPAVSMQSEPPKNYPEDERPLDSGDQPNKQEQPKTFTSKARRVISSQLKWNWLLWKQAFSHARHNWLMYLLGFISVFLVVCLIAVFSGIAEYSSVVVTRLIEKQQGQLDVVIGGPNYMNYTVMSSVWDNLSYSEGEKRFRGHQFRFHAPRFQVRLSASPWVCTELDGGEVCSATDLAVNSWLYGLKLEREREIQLSEPSFRVRSIPYGTAVISESLANTLRLEIGSSVVARVDLASMIQWHFSNYSQINSAFRLNFVFEVIDIINPKALNQFGPTSGHNGGIFVEYDDIRKYILQHLEPGRVSEYEQERFPSLDGLATQIILNFPQPKEQYQSPNYQTIQERCMGFVTRALIPFDFLGMDVKLPVLQGVRDYQFISLFLGLLVLIVLVVFMVLAYVILYSLFMFSVQARTFEAGVYRLIGMRKLGLFFMITTQTLLIALPSWGLGLGIAQALFIPMSNYLSNATNSTFPQTLPTASIIYGCILGLIVPIIASIIPLKNAFQITPAEAFQHKKLIASKGQKVTIVREDNLHETMPLGLVIISVVGIVYGFVIYYLFPKALLASDLQLLLVVFLILLLSILFGMSIVFINLDLISMKLTYWLFFFWESRLVKKLVFMSLVAHRLQGRKTFAMYIVAIALVIYLNVIAFLQVDTFESFIQQQYGASIHVISSVSAQSTTNPSGFNPTCAAQLESVAKVDHVVGVSWVALPLKHGKELYDFRNLGGAFQTQSEMRAVLPTFSRLLFSKFIDIQTVNHEKHYEEMTENEGNLNVYNPFKPSTEDSALTADEKLYTFYGANQFIVHDSVLENLGLSKYSEFLVDRINPLKPYVLSRIAGIASMFTGLQSTVFDDVQPSLTSFPTAVRLSDGYNSIQDLPLERFIIQTDLNYVAGEVKNQQEYYAIMDRIRSTSACTFGNQLTLYELSSDIASLQDTKSLLRLGFFLVSLFAMLICSFSLITSMFANVNEQTKEIAILRALGVTSWLLFRVHIGESFVTLLTASLFGILTGWLVATAQSLQQQLFLGLPSSLYFPWIAAVVVLAFSLVSSILGSLLTCRHGRKHMVDELRSVA